MLLDTERAIIIRTILHKDGQKLHVLGQKKLHILDRAYNKYQAQWNIILYRKGITLLLRSY